MAHWDIDFSKLFWLGLALGGVACGLVCGGLGALITWLIMR